MRISLTGLIKNVSRSLKSSGDPWAYAFELKTLLKNLKELKARKAEGEKVIDEFFDLYVIED